jgi:hypothetical protein
VSGKVGNQKRRMELHISGADFHSKPGNVLWQNNLRAVERKIRDLRKLPPLERSETFSVNRS